MTDHRIRRAARGAWRATGLNVRRWIQPPRRATAFRAPPSRETELAQRSSKTSRSTLKPRPARSRSSRVAHHVGSPWPRRAWRPCGAVPDPRGHGGVTVDHHPLPSSARCRRSAPFGGPALEVAARPGSGDGRQLSARSHSRALDRVLDGGDLLARRATTALRWIVRSRARRAACGRRWRCRSARPRRRSRAAPGRPSTASVTAMSIGGSASFAPRHAGRAAERRRSSSGAGTRSLPRPARPAWSPAGPGRGFTRWRRSEAISAWRSRPRIAHRACPRGSSVR